MLRAQQKTYCGFSLIAAYAADVPFFLLYGRECRSHNLNLPQVNLQDIKNFNVAGYAHDYAEMMNRIWDIIKDKCQKNKSRLNKIPKRRLEYKPYTVNDKVMMKVIPPQTFTSTADQIQYQLTASLANRYSGPYIVLRVLGPTLFEIQKGTEPPIIAHSNRLKPALLTHMA